jgi:hypothetical protein
MTNSHPIIPSHQILDELFEEVESLSLDKYRAHRIVVTRSAQWGADQELEACCEILQNWGSCFSRDLRDARRTPNLKKQALESLHHLEAGCEPNIDLLRRALEQLPDDA